jgi:hypothetical protein
MKLFCDSPEREDYLRELEEVDYRKSRLSSHGFNRGMEGGVARCPLRYVEEQKKRG